jgi:inositol polyphosphate 5-phosphatase INPP5B/F
LLFKLTVSTDSGEDSDNKSITTLVAPSDDGGGKSNIDASASTLVKEDESDPDILVLGFQELDLSTGALVYYTDTTREDAWTTAAFAGLGEKAELYEKVVRHFSQDEHPVLTLVLADF